MFDLLRRMDLHPLEWESVVQETGKASPYLGEVIETGFAASYRMAPMK
jgi:hypothetical protein